MTQEEFNTFEENLQMQLLKVSTSLGLLDGTLLASDDIDCKWKEFAPEYMVDAVKNYNDYPYFTLACAGYAGAAVAKWWDEDWGRHHNAEFKALQGPRGFDDMDDNIAVNLLGYALDSADAGVLRSTFECLTQQAVTFIRHSQIEAGTADALRALERTAYIIYRLGAAIELKKLGYRFQAVNTTRFS